MDQDQAIQWSSSAQEKYPFKNWANTQAESHRWSSLAHKKCPFKNRAKTQAENQCPAQPRRRALKNWAIPRKQASCQARPRSDLSRTGPYPGNENCSDHFDISGTYCLKQVQQASKDLSAEETKFKTRFIKICQYKVQFMDPS
jgi:hypothetical protein